MNHLELASQIARRSRCKYKHGAVLVKRGKVIAVSTNIRRNDPEWDDWRICSVHAEEGCLAKVGVWAHGSTMFIARVNVRGVVRDSAPCKRCAGLMARAGVVKVIHT